MRRETDEVDGNARYQHFDNTTTSLDGGRVFLLADRRFHRLGQSIEAKQPFSDIHVKDDLQNIQVIQLELHLELYGKLTFI